MAVLSIVVLAMFLMGYFKDTGGTIPNPHWSADYRREIELKGIPEKNLEQSSFYDYDSQAVQDAITKIKSEAYNEEHAVELAAEYVYKNVKYSWSEPDNTCFRRSGSEVLEAGIGQCDTQTRALVTILRGMGIAATPVAGCLAIDYDCKLQQTVSGERLPKMKELTYEDLQEDEISRAGGLHTWAKVYLPDQGWVDIESTSGQFVEGTCYKYVEEYIPQTIKQECVSTNRSFAEMCREL